MVAVLTVFFRYTRFGLAFRAVADDQFAALAVGLRLPRDLGAASGPPPGVVALVAGLLWGARLGVQFSLSLIVLKALPVLVLGGFDSIAGAIVAGLVIGASEKLAEVYLGAYRRRRHRGLVRLRRGARLPAGAPDRPVRPAAGREGTEAMATVASLSLAVGARVVQDLDAWRIGAGSCLCAIGRRSRAADRRRLSVRGDPDCRSSC